MLGSVVVRIEEVFVDKNSIRVVIDTETARLVIAVPKKIFKKLPVILRYDAPDDKVKEILYQPDGFGNIKRGRVNGQKCAKD